MNKTKTLILLTLFGGMALQGHAESPFRDLIASVIENDSEIISKTVEIDASLASASAENSLEGPELEFEYLWANTSSDDNRWSAGISQEFAMPGLYSSRRAAAQAEAESSRVVLLGIKADKALEAKQLILDIINANAHLKFYMDLQDNLHRISELTRHSYDIGEATVLDLRKMQIAEIDNESKISDAMAGIYRMHQDLKALGAELPESTEMWQSYPVQLCEKPDEGSNSFFIALEQAQMRAAEAKTKAVKMQAWPTISLGYHHAFEDQTHFNGLSVGLKLPSFSQKKRREAARLEAESLIFDTKNRIITENAENQSLYDSAVKTREMMNRYGELINDNTYLELLAKAYDGGQLTVIDYLNEVNLFSNARHNFMDMQYRYNLTLARLNRYRGMDF